MSCHGGFSETLNFLRQKFWIPSARRIVRTVVSKCIVCRRFSKYRYQVPESPVLPEFRVDSYIPFAHSGVDFAGPIFTTVGDKREKAYIALFTCGTTRAVHLELTAGMSIDDFLLAFRRFCSYWGSPSALYSDNAKTFVASFSEVKVLVKLFTKHQSIDWHFIPPHAPWWGGFWERLVGVVKRPLRKLLSKRLFSFDEVRTILAEVQFIVNQRPLTYVGDDNLEIICPSHILYGLSLIHI